MFVSKTASRSKEEVTSYAYGIQDSGFRRLDRPRRRLMTRCQSSVDIAECEGYQGIPFSFTAFNQRFQTISHYVRGPVTELNYLL